MFQVKSGRLFRWSAAFTLIELLVSIGVLAMFAALSLAAIEAIREQARTIQCQSNLRQLALGVSSYEASFGKLPMATYPAFSTFVTILPFMEHQNEYDKIDFSDFPQSASTVLTRNPPAPHYQRCPTDSNFVMSRIDPELSTSYLASKGTAWLLGSNNGVFSWYFGEHPRFSHIRDGLSNTLSFSEFAQGTTSNRLRRIEPDRNTDVANITIEVFDHLVTTAPALSTDRQIGETWYTNGLSNAYYTHYLCPGSKSGVYKGLSIAAYSPSSNHPGRIQTARADGSVSAIGYGVDRNLWNQLGDRNDGGKSFFGAD